MHGICGFRCWRPQECKGCWKSWWTAMLCWIRSTRVSTLTWRRNVSSSHGACISLEKAWSLSFFGSASLVVVRAVSQTCALALTWMWLSNQFVLGGFCIALFSALEQSHYTRMWFYRGLWLFCFICMENELFLFWGEKEYELKAWQQKPHNYGLLGQKVVGRGVEYLYRT